MKASFHHLSIIASSEASVVFYSRLGFKEIKRINRDNDTVVLMQGNGMMLELFVDPSHPKRATETENIGLRYFSLTVDDLENIYDHFECGPVKTDWFGKRYCFIFDPDGLPIQIHE
jgi:glyoxylase I family protein